IDRLRSVGHPAVSAATVLPFAAGVQKLIDVEFEDGHRYYTKEAHLADLAGEAIDPACDADYTQRTRTVVRDLAPWVGQGVYFNMLNVDELDRVAEALGGPEKYARLGRVKARYDPENLFRANYNIVPVSEG
ncbi:MAG TPA: BBE domain-containing protein, partial [Streptosporangiaceae bacterium]